MTVSCLLFVETESLTKPGALQLARLAGEQASGSLLSAPSFPGYYNQCWGSRHALPHFAFMWVLSMWVWQVLYQLSHLPGPGVCLDYSQLMAGATSAFASVL